jgi:3-mercaptopropionate dioxygenase
VSALDLLIADVSRSVVVGRPAARVAEEVRSSLKQAVLVPDLLTPAHRRSSGDRYQQHILHVAPDQSFSVVALVWLPGQRTPIHNHRAWCVVGVHEGEEFETGYEIVAHAHDGPRLRAGESRTNLRGFTCSLVPPSDVHLVENRSGQVAISVHVYGVDMHAVGSSIERRFDASTVDVVIGTPGGRA